MELEQPQSKRTRRPSVRLGEIGEIGFTSSSSLWLEAPKPRRKQQLSNGALKHQPRIRPLEQVAGEMPPEEEWSVVEPVVASPILENLAVVNDGMRGKRRSGGGFSKERGGLRWTGSKVRGRHEDTARSEPPVENNREDDKDRLPEFTPSSDSEELTGRGLKLGEEDQNGANPNSHGEEMQGAIEDGPHGKGFNRTVKKQGKRRSGRQVVRRNDHIASRDTASRDTASRDIAEEPFAAAAAVEATIVTPSSSQRRVALSAGVSGWLQELGLGKYSELFELNEVDTQVLPLLTMDDLREMGVDAVGARRKMYSNIQELGLLRGI